MSQPDSLSILFVPLPSPGHIIPMIDIANILASHGTNCTIILTRVPATRFEASITRAKTRNHNMQVHILPFPSTPLLPPNCESTDMLPSRSLSEPFGLALENMQAEFDEYVRSRPPDIMVSDLLMHWTGYVATELRIPRYVFPGTGCFAMSVELAVQMNMIRVDGERVLVAGLPDPVCLTQSKLAETTLPGRNSKEFFERAREADQSTVGMIVNSFDDLEPGYAAHYEKVTGKQVWMVGPVSLCNQDPMDVVERGRGRVISEASKIFSWLDMKPSKSVMYVCFGSLCKFPFAQLKEIGSGLKGSGVPFVWVIRDEDGGPAHREWIEWFESGLEGKGIVATGWVPQVGVLGHRSVGAFMTHCGWGSVTEAVSAGVPMLTWPLFAEQFYNEVVVTEVVGCGVKIGVDRGYIWGKEESVGVVLEAEKIKEKVSRIMTGKGEEERDVREKAKMLGEKAREGMDVDGPSYVNVGRLTMDMRVRSGRAGACNE